MPVLSAGDQWHKFWRALRGKSVFELAVSVREERCSPIASCPACPAAPARTAPAAGQPRGNRAGSVRERYRARYERLSSKVFLVKKITFVNDSALGKWTCPDQRRFHLGSPGAGLLRAAALQQRVKHCLH